MLSPMNRDREIVQALRKRDEEGARDLLRAHGDRLLRSACLLTDSEADARDLVQDTLVKAVRTIHRFREGSSLYTWLHGILINLHRNQKRKRRTWLWTRTFPTSEMAVAPEEACKAMDRAASPLVRLLQELDPLSRQIVVLHYYEEMKLLEIARHTGIPLGTVKTRLHRAMAWLQKKYRNLETF